MASAERPWPEEQLVLAPAERRPAVLRAIRSAQRRVAISMFRCTDYFVLDELAEAIRRRAQVEALLTPRTKGIERKRLKGLGVVLEGMGAKVYRYSDPLVKYHAKYMVVDDGPALVGSLNFTAKCFTNTCDFLLVTHDPEVVSGLRSLFEADCASTESPLPKGLTDRLIVGPDQARSRLAALLQEARRSIRIIDHKLSDPSMVALLKGRKAAGVQVEILGSGQVAGLRSHGKMILVDDSAAVIGSIGLAPLHLDFRREVAVVIRDATAVRQLRDFFESAAKAQPPRAAAGAPAVVL